jgi:hypothetical protein
VLDDVREETGVLPAEVLSSKSGRSDRVIMARRLAWAALAIRGYSSREIGAATDYERSTVSQGIVELHKIENAGPTPGGKGQPGE